MCSRHCRETVHLNSPLWQCTKHMQALGRLMPAWNDWKHVTAGNKKVSFYKTIGLLCWPISSERPHMQVYLDSINWRCWRKKDTKLGGKEGSFIWEVLGSRVFMIRVCCVNGYPVIIEEILKYEKSLYLIHFSYSPFPILYFTYTCLLHFPVFLKNIFLTLCIPKHLPRASVVILGLPIRTWWANQWENNWILSKTPVIGFPRT